MRTLPLQWACAVMRSVHWRVLCEMRPSLMLWIFKCALQDCQHNTQGGFCEDCAFGFYGDATEGSHDACKPCACPMVDAENNFAQGCIASDQGSRDYMCIGCKMGFEGEFCERFFSKFNLGT